MAVVVEMVAFWAIIGGGHTPWEKVKVAMSEPVSAAVPLRLGSSTRRHSPSAHKTTP